MLAAKTNTAGKCRQESMGCMQHINLVFLKFYNFFILSNNECNQEFAAKLLFHNGVETTLNK